MNDVPSMPFKQALTSAQKLKGICQNRNMEPAIAGWIFNMQALRISSLFLAYYPMNH